MRSLIFFLIPFLSFAQVTLDPTVIEIDQMLTITVDVNSSDSDCNGINNPSKLYLHSGVGNETNAWEINVVGNWGNDDGVGEMINNGNGIWSISFIPKDYFDLSDNEANLVTRMGMVFRNENGTQELKDNGCVDFIFNVGPFQVTMINPSSDGVILINPEESTQILAENTNGNADYELLIEGISFHQLSNVNSYQSPQILSITENKFCELVITQGETTIIKPFKIVVNNTINEPIPAGISDGINYDDSDSSKAFLVVNAPHKEFIYVSGSFNDWRPDNDDAMKKDTNSDKFWIELENLTPGQSVTYQYWVYDQNPESGSPKEVRTADPFSTLVLSPFDDEGIPENSYPDLPSYPDGQNREVTILQTGQESYDWQITNFEKPNKEDLVIYEVLLRDFDINRNFQDLIDKVDYFKNLNINAIEIMPIMEFEGNESWGYNPVFHMALDKFYGTEDKFRELVDTFHQNGIAIILDLAINHAFRRNRMVRMWMNDSDLDGWGDPSRQNPYFNSTATHSYSVGSDFNHSSDLTQYYTKRVIKHWIESFKIDGIRWDLTKGFTQNCSASDDACTNLYQSDRVEILKEYADYSWSLDPDHYVIFEHLGVTQEQKEWADYRVSEGKGIMLWSNMSFSFSQLAMGYSDNSDISGIGHNSQNFIEKRLIGYFESHDEERIMYRNLQFGASNGDYDVTDLQTALDRMPAIGAISLLVPGPKMIWHFGELGMENSIYTCEDGTVNDTSGDDNDCRLDTKPQPQWSENWMSDPNRIHIYNTWSRLNKLKIDEEIFEGDYSIDSGNLTPRIYIWNDLLDDDALKNIVILSNFDLSTQSITPNFPYTGVWYDLMDENSENSITVSDTEASINLEPGEFKIFGNQPSTTLNVEDPEYLQFKIFPNPAHNFVKVNETLTNLNIYDLLGKKVLKFEGRFNENFPFDISSLVTGFYIVEIRSSNQTKQTKLLNL